MLTVYFISLLKLITLISPSTEILQYLLFPTDTNIYKVSLDTTVMADIALPIESFTISADIDIYILDKQTGMKDIPSIFDSGESCCNFS